MPLFTYRATGPDNKEVRGSVDAPDEIAARKAVEDQHLEVVEIVEASRARPDAPTVKVTPEPEMPSFAFEGKDQTGAIRRGTLQASTKYEAFKRLRDDQKLVLNMLSPVGVLPQFRDTELEQWQKTKITSVPKLSVSSPPTAMPAFKRPTVGFTNIPEAPKAAAPVAVQSASDSRYHSIASTLRLYAGWLLAWYGLFVAVGYYAMERALPWDIPFVQAFYVSPLIFSFIVAMFLFLLLSSISRLTKGGIMTNLALSLVGLGLFVGARLLAA